MPPESLLRVSPLTNLLHVLHDQAGFMWGTLELPFSPPTPIEHSKVNGLEWLPENFEMQH